MAPAARWVIGILAALVAAGLWMYWNSRDQPPAPAPKQALANLDTAKAAPEPAPVAAVAPVAPKVEALTATVYFDFDQSALRSGEAPKLDDLAARIKGRTFDHIDALGYADRIGEEPYNDQLSRKRAEAVVAYLVANGVEAARVRAEAKGESESSKADACKGMGPDNGKNQKLVECLQRDRYVLIKLL